MVSYLRKNILSSGSFLVATTLLSNFINLAYNAYLGKALSFSDFGLITLINTLLYVASIIFGAVASTVNHQVSYLTARHGHEAGISYYNRLVKKSALFVGATSLLWILSIEAIENYFNLSSTLPLWSFLFILTLGFWGSLSGGFIKGRFMFYLTGSIYIIESLAKFFIAYVLVTIGYSSFTYLSIPLSISVSALVTILAVIYISKKEKVKHPHTYNFSSSFFTAAALTGFSSTAFLTFDILLTKHFFSPTNAGIYAFLALIGKMIFFFGSLLTAFMIPFVSRDEGSHRDPNRNFYMLFLGTIILTVSACFGLIFVGPTILPIIFGEKARQISQYLPMYSAAIGLYTLSNTINTFHLARRHYFFSVLAVLSSLAMTFGIYQNHNSINTVLEVILKTSVINFLIVSVVHTIQRNGGFLLRNLLDLVDLFRPYPKLNYTPLGKRILIFNWRDTKHVYSGGAEVYVHELAKRWVKSGNSVMLFCGNDGNCPRYEVIDGVNIVRRGGFYLVYFWAFVYYTVRFRGKFDIIIDCENGIPFFTPLYAKENMYLLIHHIHQEVFRKSLRWPFSSFASFLEIKLMPYAYQNIQFVTVSPSTKKEIIQHQLTKSDPLIVYNGIDQKLFKPKKKSKSPLVLYLGRLQYYKSIHTYIKVAKNLSKRFPSATFTIAGEGEELHKLKTYAHRIQSPVTFLGKVTEDEKLALLQQAWVMVNPSSMEGWGLTVIEANACGTPVVASDVPGLRDSVMDGKTGYLCAYGDVEAFAVQVAKLLKNSRHRGTMSRNAYQWSKQFSWNKSAVQLSNHFNRRSEVTSGKSAH